MEVNRIRLFVENLRKNLKGWSQFNDLRKLEKSEILFFCHDINRNYLFRGLKYAPIIDTLNEIFTNSGRQTLTISRHYSATNPKECFGNVRQINGLMARASFFDYFCSFLKVLFPFFKKDTKRISAKSRAWIKILDHVQPKIIIGVEPLKELCIAAKLKDICVVDIQHGAQLTSDGSKSGHFYRLEYRAPHQAGWPDFVACWDQSSVSLMKKYRSEYTKPFCLGHPWIERFQNTMFINDELKKELDNKYKLIKKQPVILFSLQYTRDKYGNSNSFSPIPQELDRYVKQEGSKYTWWIRIHPQLLREPHIANILKAMEDNYSGYNNVNWKEVSFAPLPYVLGKIDLHLTRNSSVTKEASMMRIKTGLLDIQDRKKDLEGIFSKEVKNGNAQVLGIDSYNEIKGFIEQSIEADAGGTNTSNKSNIQAFVKAVSISIENNGSIESSLCSLSKNMTS